MKIFGKIQEILSGGFRKDGHEITLRPSQSVEYDADIYMDLPPTKISDELVGKDAQQTLTQKTLTTPTIASFINATHNHQSDAAGMKLDHTAALTNVGSNTHSQIDTHIASTSNPHSVTKTQVGLSNVTNDAQVKKVSSVVSGNFVSWSGISGDTVADSGVNSSSFATSGQGVTNGDSHDHSGGDGAQIRHTTLSDIGSNTHAQIDTHISRSDQVHGLGVGDNVVGLTSSQTLTNKKYDGGTASEQNVMLLSAASRATLNAISRKRGAIYFDTTNTVYLYDDGSNLKEITSSDLTQTLANKTFSDNIKLEDPGVGTNKITVQAPTLSGDWTLTLPTSGGSAGRFLKTDGAGNTSWDVPAGAGDVAGPSSSVDNAIVRFDGTTGKVIQGYTSGDPTISDTGVMTVNNTTDSSSKDSGSLIVEGGVGIEKNIYSGTGVYTPYISMGDTIVSPYQKLLLYSDSANAKFGFGIANSELRMFCPAASANHISLGSMSNDGNNTWTERMRLEHSGNIGIGTGAGTIDARLHVKNNTTDGSVKLENTGGTASAWILQSNGGYSTAAFGIYSLTASAYRQWIDGSGNTRIGSMNPATDTLVSTLEVIGTQLIGTAQITTGGNKLTINQGANVAPASSGTTQNAALRLRGGDNGVLDMGVNGGNYSWLQATDLGGLGNCYPLILNPNGGNVGISVTSPSAYGNGGSPRVLEIGNTGSNAYGNIVLSTNQTSSGSPVGALVFATSGASGFKRVAQISSELDASSGTNAEGRILFYTATGGSQTERMRITSLGKIGIGGDTSPAALLSCGANVVNDVLHLYHSGNIKYGFGIASSEFRMYCPTTNHISIGTVSTSDGTTWSEKVRINDDGSMQVDHINEFTSGHGTAVKGRTDSTDTDAGYLGEYKESGTSYSEVTSGFTNGQYKNIATVTLNKGRYLLRGGLIFGGSLEAQTTQYRIAISLYSDNTTTDHVQCKNVLDVAHDASTQGDSGMELSGVYLKITSDSTAVYLKAFSGLFGATPNVRGHISAIRVG